ncbi:MAG TPA: kelch repeat-containing protein [Tenuifilaceae bacterium]|nr:kelch repeat-containing protein [Tenuifilaceae bacterium]HPI44143.1 kelch repeat-containing protein [Tenuifilaceae bacterium]HPN21266.1 kelch repeat-containing protein [Tenuifilaceae bacterium]
MNFRIRSSLYLFFITLIFTPQLLKSQSIRGQVLNSQNNPLIGASIIVNRIGIGTTTNEKGEYNLNYNIKISESDSITFSFIGYISQKLTISELKKKNFIVGLTESVQPIKEVSITIEKKHLKLQIAYKKLESLKYGLYSFGAILIDDKIWVVGGDKSYQSGRGLRPMFSTKPSFSYESYSDKLCIYDIQTNKWIESNQKFSKRAYHNIQYYNGKVYIIGGKKLSTNRIKEYLADEVEVYSIKDSNILTDNTNPHQAVNFASFVYKDNLIVMGGSTKLTRFEEKICTNKAHLLNLKTGLWYELNDIPIAMETKGILVNNTIFLVGGFNTKPLDKIVTYNITTGEWRVLGQLFYEVERPALALKGSTIYIFEDGRIQTYDINSKQLKLYSIDLPLKSSELFYRNDKLYLLGGFVEDTSFKEPTSNLYSIDINEFNTTATFGSKTL